MTNIQVVDNLSAWTMVWSLLPVLVLALFIGVRFYVMRKAQNQLYQNLLSEIRIVSNKCENIGNKVNLCRNTAEDIRGLKKQLTAMDACLSSLEQRISDVLDEPEEHKELNDVVVQIGSDEYHLKVHVDDIPELLSFDASVVEQIPEPTPEESTLRNSKPLDLQSIAKGLKV
jgi:hypothetical protein